MSDSFSPIRPKQVPLSHVQPQAPKQTLRTGRWLTASLGILLMVGLLVGVFVFVPAWLEGRPGEPAEVTGASGAPPGGASANDAGGPGVRAGAASQPAAGAEDPALPPYQQLQREQTRQKAQEQLARFVELQIALEDSMQVGAWGAADYDAAKSRAAAGDGQFVREQFEQAMASYQAATATLQKLLDRGRTLLEDAITRGQAALASRDEATAAEAYELARTIAPEDPRVATGEARLALLPRINTLMREARNQELADDWAGAQATYEEVRGLDPGVDGLDVALARVADGRRETRVQALLSTAFADLDGERFDAARDAFRNVLKLAPDNAVAKGGLEQVTKRSDVVLINALQERADTAGAEERWEDAVQLYGEVLDIDPTIRFAQAGRGLAEAQQGTAATLSRIIQNPERLSSDKLFREATAILERAATLEPRGPTLARQIEDVGTILDTYANPVPVILRSDNRTEVTLSSVGALGSFEEKRLELRPGAYTVIGSRDGCRDVREQIVVRPNMNPVDIRCAETL